MDASQHGVTSLFFFFSKQLSLASPIQHQVESLALDEAQ
jgi:hypothetical protein